MRISDWSSDVCSSDRRRAIGCRKPALLPAGTLLGDRITREDLGLVHENMGRHAADPIVAADQRFAKFGPMLHIADDDFQKIIDKIGRASCRERECTYG